MVKDIILSTRPKQWVKNSMVFVGLIFSNNLLNPTLLIKNSLGFLALCLLTGGVYIINDWFDLEKDRKHPVKSKRPLASGRLKPALALAIATVLIVLSLGLSFWLEPYFAVIAAGYLVLQILYSWQLKHIVALDVLIIAVGFLLRVIAGPVLISVEISSWLIFCTSLGALFVALGKRRGEIALLEKIGGDGHTTFKGYDTKLLDQLIGTVTAATIITYMLYTASAETVAKFHTRNLEFTIPFVIYGLFRYLYLVYRQGAGAEPENLLFKDRPLLVCIILWVAVVGLVIYIR